MLSARRLISLLPLVLLLPFLTVTAGPAAADPLTWSAPSALTGTPIVRAVSCPTENLCVAVGSGRPNGSVILVSTSPADPSSWRIVHTAGGSGYDDVSCPTQDFCIALRGIVVATSTNPASGVFTDSTLSGLVGTRIACASAALCVTNGYRNVNWHNTYGVAPFTASANWSAMPTPPMTSFNDISCLGGACLAVSGYGLHVNNALAPGSAFTQARFPGDPAPWLQPSAISCVASTCMLVTDSSGFPNPVDGGVWVSTDRTTWTRSTLPDVSLPAQLECVQKDGAVRCVTATLAARGAFTDTRSIADTDRPDATRASDWAVLPALFGDTTGGSDDIVGVGCASPRVCVAFSFDGRVSVGTAAAPGGGTTPPVTPPAPASRTAVRLADKVTVLKQRRAVFSLQGTPGDDYIAKLTSTVPANSVRAVSAKKVTVRLGTAKGTFDKDGRAKVRLKVTKKGRAALARLGKVKATLSVTTDSSPDVQRFRITVKRPR